MDWWTVIGTAASVAGLVTSVWVLFVAKDARDAANAARALARTRNLVEELEAASQKIQQVGNFIQQEQWAAVRLRSEEILGICNSSLARWPDHLSEDRRNELMNTARQMVSITRVTAQGTAVITPHERRKITDAQIRASGHISSALGEARNAEERDADNATHS